MYMKNHILAALREEFAHWEAVLASMSEEQIAAPLKPSDLSIKDEIAHLWAWQQRSIARMEAALHNREPELPQWLPMVDPADEGNTDQVNAWIYATHRERPWLEVYQDWRSGFLRLVALGEEMPEPALLDSSRFAWLEGHALAFVLIATYDHHQEHLENVIVQTGLRQDEIHI